MIFAHRHHRAGRFQLSAFILHPSSFILLFLLVLLASPVVAAKAPIAEPVDGEPFAGAIAGIDAQWRITFGGSHAGSTWPAADLVQWGTPAEVTRCPLLVLGDGGLIVAETIRGDATSLWADSETLGMVRLPRTQTAGAVLHLPSDRPHRDGLLDRVAAGGGQTDCLLLRNGDEVRGTIETLGDEQVRLLSEVGALTVATDRIAAIVFRTAVAPAAPPRTLLVWSGFADGSRLRAMRLVVDGQAKTLRLTLPGGSSFAAAASDLVWLQPLGGRAEYLSDRRVEGYRHVPFLSLAWPYRTDRSVEGHWLRSAGRLYLKGLGVHSAARLTYLLDGSYRRFAADLGIDDETSGGGSVRFRVFVDGQSKYASEVVRGAAPPTAVSLDITGAKRLDLVVDFADRADELDHADWLNARLVGGRQSAVGNRQ
jgi:hypothetical protein